MSLELKFKADFWANLRMVQDLSKLTQLRSIERLSLISADTDQIEELGL